VRVALQVAPSLGSKLPLLPKPGLPLSFGQRVTFFAGTKKVTAVSRLKCNTSLEEVAWVSTTVI
jgi:hypothetical protein